FLPLANTKSIPIILIDLIVMLVLQAAYIGPQPALFSELFSPAVRYSGASLSLQLGTLLGGAIFPLVAAALYDATKSSWSVTSYATALILISFLCQLALRNTYQRDIGSPVNSTSAPV